MTISSTVRVAGPYTGTGIVSTYPFGFKVFQASDLLVTQTDTSGNNTTLALTTNYSVTLNADQNAIPGGSITLVNPLASGYQLRISSQVQELQGTSITNNGGFYPSVIESALDYLTILVQQLQATLSLCLELPPNAQGSNVSNLMPYPAASQLLGWDPTGSFLVNTAPSGVGAGTITGGSAGGAIAASTITDYNVAANAGILVSKLSFLAAGAHALARVAQNKMREIASVQDDGATGNGVANDGPSIANAMGDYSEVTFPTGTYLNSSATVTLPFNQTAIFSTGTDIVTSGSGTTTLSGVTIRRGYNPSGQTSWTDAVTYNYEGLAVDFGGYGPRAFGANGLVLGLVGAVNVPAVATIPAHSAGVAGYAKSASTTTAAVAIYGEGNVEATNVQAWGINTRTMDNGFATTLYGYECDINITNASTNVYGIDVTGGSTTAGSATIGCRIGPLGTFANPAIKWGRAFFADDGSATTGLEIGASKRVGDTGATSVGSMPINMYYINASSARTLGWTTSLDGSGNATLEAGISGSLFVIKTFGSTANNIALLSNAVGFFGASPINQPNTTGTTAGFTANTGTAMNSGSTSTGNTGSTAYTFGDVVNNLKRIGLLVS